MRKITSNYIYLPGYPLVKNGYVVLDGGKVVGVVDTGGIIREIEALEFYGGMIVDKIVLSQKRDWTEGQPLLPWLEQIYAGATTVSTGLALIKGADLRKKRFTAQTEIELLP